MIYPFDLNAPWSLHFDRDGTEDIGIICDALMNDLVTSHHFWLPEPGDRTPATPAKLRFMTVAPELYDALTTLLDVTIHADTKFGLELTPEKREARIKAMQALQKAEGFYG